MKISELMDKNILVWGYGIEGKSIVEILLKNNIKNKIFVATKDKLDLSLVGENEEDQIIYTVGYYDEANYRPAKLRVTLNSGEQYEGNLQRQTGVGITASLGINYASSINSVCDVQLPYQTQESDIAKIELVNVFFIDELSNGSFYEVFPRFSDDYEIEIEVDDADINLARMLIEDLGLTSKSFLSKSERFFRRLEAMKNG